MAKLTEPAAIALLMKLERTSNFPQDKAGVKSLAKVLIEAAPEPEHAAKVVEELRRACQFCPTDAEIFGVANALRIPKWRPLESCPDGKCDGSGWIAVETPYRSGVKSCSCRKAKVVS